MAKIPYTDKKLSTSKLKDIELANSIIATYTAQGYELTVRQIYYQFVSRGWVANRVESYDYIQGLLTDGRLNGLIDWDAIVDRTRGLRSIPHYLDAKSLLSEQINNFATWKWADQPNYVETWVEKDALRDIVAKACNKHDVPFLSCRGYTSVSEVHAAAMRFSHEIANGKRCHLIHIGDHDPSGIDMTRDIAERLRLVFQVPVKVYRIALNMGQIERYNPPPNPAKVTDSRAKSYIEKFGESSWEVDALEPSVLVELIETNIQKFKDENLFRAAAKHEESERAKLSTVVERWTEVCDLISKPPGSQEDNPYAE